MLTYNCVYEGTGDVTWIRVSKSMDLITCYLTTQPRRVVFFVG